MLDEWGKELADEDQVDRKDWTVVVDGGTYEFPGLDLDQRAGVALWRGADGFGAPSRPVGWR